MKPTKEQIEAALMHVEDKSNISKRHIQIITRLHGAKAYTYVYTSAKILAAAYRELQAENERLKQPSEIICTKCGLRKERGEKPKSEF